MHKTHDSAINRRFVGKVNDIGNEKGDIGMTTTSNPLRLTAIVTNTQEINDVMHLLRQTQLMGYTGEITVEVMKEEVNAPISDCVSLSVAVQIRRFGFMIGARIANKQRVD